MLKPFIVSVVLIAAFGLTSCDAPVGPTESVDDRVAKARARNDGPAIWKVTDYNSTLYVFGTMHLIPQDGDWLRDDLKAVVRESGTVFFEVDTTKRGRIDATVLSAQLGFRQDGLRLADGLDNYQLKLLDAVANNGNIPLSTLDSMKPWLASEFLTLSAAQTAGLSADLSADEALKSMARRQQKNVIYLESVEDQIRAVADLPEGLQIEVLTETMEDFDDIGNQLVRMFKGWAVGQTDFLTQQMIAPMKLEAGELYRSVLVDRNEKWAKILIPHLEGEGTSLVAVGIAHLLGEESLLEHFKESGYDVERHYAFMGENVIEPTELTIERPDRDAN